MKKRALSILLALTLLLGLLPAALAADVPALCEPVGLEWGVEYGEDGTPAQVPGMMSWQKGELHQNEFMVTVYHEDGRRATQPCVWSFTGTSQYADSKDFLLEGQDLPSGNYYFTVGALGDNINYISGPEARSPLWTYTRPEAQLPALTGLNWSWPSARWSPLAGQSFYCYNVEWFYSKTENGSYNSVGNTFLITEPSRTIPDSCVLYNGEGFYKFRVQVISSDITAVRSSAWSAMSPAYSLKDLTGAVLGGLGGIDTNTDPDSIREQLYDAMDFEVLKSAMMADQGSSGVIGALSRLENAAGGPAAVSSTLSQFNTSDVSIVGAGLSVPDGSPLALKVGKPENDGLVVPSNLSNSLAIKFSMSLEGVEDPDMLYVPVRVTLPVPDTIDPNFLRIVHYHADGSSEVLDPIGDIYVYQQGGKTFASFVLTSFSDFVMTVTKEGEPAETPDPGPDEPVAVPKSPLTKDMFEVDTAAVTYTGQAHQPTVKALRGSQSSSALKDTVPVLNQDYTVSYKDNVNAGTAAITITGMGEHYLDTSTLTYSFTIKPKPLTITGASVAGKTYDGTTTATVNSVTFDAAPYGFTGYTAAAAFADAKAGADKPVTVKVTLTDKNYTLASGTFSAAAAIHKAALPALPAAVVMKNAADYTADLDLSALALPRGETFAFAVGTADNVTAQLAGDGKTLTLTASGSGSNKAQATVTGESANYTVTVTVAVSYTDKTPVTLSGVQVAGKTYDGKAVAYTGTLTVKDGGKSVTADPAAVTYEWFSAANMGAPLAEAPANAGSYALVVTVDTSKTAAQEGGEEYYGLLSIPFTISKAAVTARAKDVTYTIGSAAPTYGVEVTGLAAGEAMASMPTASCPGADLTTAGTYPIVVSGGALPTATAANYDLRYVNGALTVKAKSSGGGGSSSSGGGGGGSSSSSTRYAVSAPKQPSNGKVALSSDKAESGDTVTLTVTPDKGYKLTQLTVTDKNGKTVKLTDKGNGKFTFTMPSSKVEVSAAFAKEDTPKEVRADAVTSAEPITKRFNDIKETNWYRDAVQYVYDRGMMNGMAPKNFEPAASASRAMMVTILYRMEGEPDAGTANFSDVADWMYYANSVAWATEKGIVTGHEDGTFQPDNEVTREQLVSMLYRYAKLKGYDTTKGKKNTQFIDSGIIEPYAQEAVEWAASIGLVNGYQDGSFRPGGKAARAEVAAILMRFCQDVARLDG